MKNPFRVFFRIIVPIITFSFVHCLDGTTQNQQAIDSLKQLIDESKQDTNQVKLLVEVGNNYFSRIPDSALLYFQEALDISEKLDYKWGLAESNRRIGISSRHKGFNDEAIEYLFKALNIFKEIDDKSAVSTCYNNIGWVHNLLSNYDKAIECFYEALNIAEDLDDKRKMAMSYNNIGNVHSDQGATERAIEFYEEALKLYVEINYKRGAAICYGNIGNIYMKEGSFNEALEYQEKALRINLELGNNIGTSICYNNMGEIYDRLGYFDEAIEYTLKAVALFEEMGYKEGIASAYGNIAYFNLEIEESPDLSETQRIYHLNKTIEYGNKAIGLAQEMKSFSIQYQAASALGEAYKRLGNYKKTLEFAEILIATKDSMFQEEKTNAILEIETKYETEKKQQQIELQESQLVAKDAKIKQQKTFRNALAAGFFAVVLVVVVFVYAYSQKRKANKKIVEQNEQILEANEELKVLNEAINKQNHEIIDSISYAERIQAAMLPPEAYITELLNENFILYKPRDIVSGDFYWIKQVNQYVVLVAADCTGHGVPGAFMSMLGISYLTEIVQRREITQANQVLNELRKQIKYSLRQHGEPDEAKDGIDLALCVLDLKNSKMQYSGANNPLYLIRDVNGTPELKEFKADRMPLGYYQGKDRAFTNHDIALEEGDTIYLFSDGFIDQKGGKDGKRFLSKKFKKLLLEIQDQSMHDQKDILDKSLFDWMGSNSQLDDILVIGVRV